jgi:hypothetical protein
MVLGEAGSWWSEGAAWTAALGKAVASRRWLKVVAARSSSGEEAELDVESSGGDHDIQRLGVK